MGCGGSKDEEAVQEGDVKFVVDDSAEAGAGGGPRPEAVKKKRDDMDEVCGEDADGRPIIGLEIDLTIISAEGLIVKDKNLFSSGGSSDPFCKVWYSSDAIGETHAVEKDLSPEWNASFKYVAAGWKYKPSNKIIVRVYDRDQMSDHDPMGEVVLNAAQLINRTIERDWPLQPCEGCLSPTGTLRLRASLTARHGLSVISKNSVPLAGGVVALCLGWDMGWQEGKKRKAIDLDTSCIGVSAQGQVLLEETVYHGDLVNSNGSVRHTGDEQEGDADLEGSADDERIIVDLNRIPPHVLAFFFVATVATPEADFGRVKTAVARLVDWSSGFEFFRFSPALTGGTALFVARLSRSGSGGWNMTTIGDVDQTARDFGTLIPEIKAYMTDLVPGLRIDPMERVAILRKGGESVRLADYSAGGVPSTELVIGLSWAVTQGVEIDLDASIIMLDAQYNNIDLVFFGKLRSSDGAIRHGGDEREGDAAGDDEKIFIQLPQLHPSVAILGVVINSYSGQELDDVHKCGCRLFDRQTVQTTGPLLQLGMSNATFLNGRTACLLAMLYRNPAEPNDWLMRAISEGAQGRTAKDNVDELQAHLKRMPPQPKPPSTPRPDPTAMALHGTPVALPVPPPMGALPAGGMPMGAMPTV